MPQPKSASSGSSRHRKDGAARERPAPKQEEPAADRLAAVRDAMTRAIMLPTDRLRETLDDAVRRGRMTRDDAEELYTTLLTAGRRQVEDLFGDVEQFVGRSRDAGRDRVLREVDRARRVAGLGSAFPISGYDDLAAAQITERLGGLSAADLRKVRDYERRNANRKTVLSAIERKLS